MTIHIFAIRVTINIFHAILVESTYPDVKARNRSEWEFNKGMIVMDCMRFTRISLFNARESNRMTVHRIIANIESGKILLKG